MEYARTTTFAAKVLERVLSWRTATLVVIASAGIALAGRIYGIRALYRPIEQMGAMNTTTAVGIILLGASLWLLQAERVSRQAKVLAWAIAGVVVLFSLFLLIDSWITPAGQPSTYRYLRDQIGRHLILIRLPRLPRPDTPVFLLIGLALLFLDVRIFRVWMAELFVIVAFWFVLLSIIGWPYGILTLSARIQLAPHTQLMFLVLLAGILYTRPDRGMMALLTDPSLAGRMMRRLLPAAILIPCALGWLVLVVEQARAQPAPNQLALGLAIFAVLSAVAVTLVVGWNAAVIWRLDTQLYRAETAHHSGEARYRALIEQSVVGFYVVDRERFLYVNPRFAEILGYTADELTLRPSLDFVAPEDRALAAENIRLRLQGDVRSVHYYLRMRHRDGHAVPVEVHGTRVDQNGGPVIIGVLLDITERKRAEEALRASEAAIAGYNERLKILRQIDKALIGGENPEAIAARALPLLRELLGVVRVVINLFDLTTGQVEWLAAAGRKRVHVGPGVRYSIRFMGDVQALRRGEHQAIDVHTLPPGPEVDALLASGIHTYTVVPMLAGSELIGSLSFGDGSGPCSGEQIAIAQEVANQFAIVLMQTRLHERIKRHAQELEMRVRERTQELEAAHTELQKSNVDLVALADELTAANKELEAFSYSVSHDLRAPLRAIDGFSRILQEDFGPQLPEGARDNLLEVRAGTQRMSQLIDDLLTFARLSRQPLRLQTVQPSEIVRQCLDELKPEHNGRQVQIVLGELPPCQADPALLKQVWTNLLANALKYTRTRDRAVIEIGHRADGRLDMVTYFVKDNGVGFDMRHADKLFGVFQRLHRAEEFEGTGVGLAFVQRIIHRHGGAVGADARKGEGATFSFSLKGRGT
jgi:PAS domain S-box-containing protein